MPPERDPSELEPARRTEARPATVAVTGASGNIGSALVRRLAGDRRVTEVRAIARRPPGGPPHPKVRWTAADVVRDDLSQAFRGADAVVHLAWRIQPSWDVEAQRAVNVDGSEQVFRAAAAAGAAIVHSSSVGAYAPGPKDPPVDEAWPLGGHPDHPYSVHKAEVEAVLDGVAATHPELRVVRMRPALVVQPGAGQELRRYFLPRHLPFGLLRASLVERLPVRFQVVLADDVADAFARAALGSASGAFNVATDDVIGARQVSWLAGLARPLASATWRAHLQPVDPGWVTLIFRSPLLDASRARSELGWQPTCSGAEALRAGLAGVRSPPDPASPALTGDPA
ncbi:MAG: NAD-dependent epimerase/dehydratase family protein [Actinobacteria bacterium]|nr:NAD-dependent epimerase/dehydratase family protein [Actinomycetota bacterium]